MLDFVTFDARCDFSYHWCGRFIAPDSSWTHMSRPLTDYELMIVTEGTVYIASGDREFTVNAGDYLLMPPTPLQHGFKSAFSSFYWLHFEVADVPDSNGCTSACDDSAADMLSIPVQGHVPAPERLIILMKQLQDSDRRYRSSSLNRYLTGAILSELSLQMRVPVSGGEARRKEQTCQDITKYISWHIGEPLRCAQVAEYFGYNEKYLTTLFTRRFGISIKQYIIREKMDRARALLTESDLPVSQIGYSLGYSDVHNFSHAFRSAVGMTPGEYRETYNEHNIFNK